MIIIEFIGNVFKGVARFFVWIITARDCEHCEYQHYSCLTRTKCCLSNEGPEECEKSITRKHFKKRGKA